MNRAVQALWPIDKLQVGENQKEPISLSFSQSTYKLISNVDMLNYLLDTKQTPQNLDIFSYLYAKDFSYVVFLH